MSRFTNRQYRSQVALAMTAYVAAMLLVWPLAHTAAGLATKVLLALVPVVPMLYVIALLVRRILGSDELEQRTHLIGLGVATAVVGVLGLVGGFLAAAQVWRTDGSILIWVFPALMLSYGATRWWVARRYGGDLSCGDGEAGVPMYLRLVLFALAIMLLALLDRHSLGDERAALLLGLSVPLGIFGAVIGVLRWRKHHRHGLQDR